MNEITLGSLYDFNKAAYDNEKPLDPVALGVKLAEIETAAYENKYWMLLCRERNDYTVFVNRTTPKGIFARELKETLANRGHVLDIEKQSDGNFEIWIKNYDTNESVVYYLFNYKYGVIEIG